VLEARGDHRRTLTRTWQNITRRIGLTPVEGIGDDVVEDRKITRLIWTSSEETRKKFNVIRTRSLVGVAIALPLLFTSSWLVIR
jgi:hypothetical protein